eukprot:TRINITY_DN16707_c0_g1_i1.p1 TRINITY_DN16707_c0_g1~~TRINITY_DN16707_c0_g1_i1.p1  ORF type:complete len:609 (+),score=149.98 TRINITY_DN16707_c0_g1_i1:1255-3081(+)
MLATKVREVLERTDRELDRGGFLAHRGLSVRLRLLWETLQREFATRQDPRAIVLVATKAGSERICAQLQVLRDGEPGESPIKGMRPAVWVGGSTSVDRLGRRIAGMKPCEQGQVLERFRQGVTNVLVATSVAKEGIDVPNCSLVVQHDCALSVQALMQSRGRARRADALFVCMIREEQEDRFSTLHLEENTMLQLALQFMDDSQPQSYKDPMAWYAPGPRAIELIKHYCASEVLQPPNFQHSQTKVRDPKSGRMFDGVRVTLRLDIKFDMPVVLTGTGHSGRQAEHDCALKACKILSERSLLTRNAKTIPRPKHITWYTSEAGGITTGGSDSDAAIVAVYRKDDWRGDEKPFEVLLAEFQRHGGRYSLQDVCNKRTLTPEGRKFRCELTICKNEADRKLLHRFCGAEASDSHDDARHTTALEVLFHYFQKRFFVGGVPAYHKDNMLERPVVKASDLAEGEAPELGYRTYRNLAGEIVAGGFHIRPAHQTTFGGGLYRGVEGWPSLVGSTASGVASGGSFSSSAASVHNASGSAASGAATGGASSCGGSGCSAGAALSQRQRAALAEAERLASVDGSWREVLTEAMQPQSSHLLAGWLDSVAGSVLPAP